MDFADVSGFAAGALGEPGARTFLLQLSGPWGRHTYLLEKAQVAALAEGFDELLSEVESEVDDGMIAPPLEDELPRFRVGQLGIGFDANEATAILSVHSVSDDDDPMIYRMTLGHLAAAARQGRAAVVAGRPRCRKCGLAMDPDGHVCPTTNGDLRHHQP